jgi:hypothetical protein
MKRIKILFFLGDNEIPCMQVECWEDEKHKFLKNTNPVYRVEIVDL